MVYFFIYPSLLVMISTNIGLLLGAVMSADATGICYEAGVILSSQCINKNFYRGFGIWAQITSFFAFLKKKC